jgi:hypothetical protein
LLSFPPPSSESFYQWYYQWRHGLALDPHYVEGWVEGCLERIGEDHPEEELLFRDLWDEETQREVLIECLKADCEVRTGRPADL